MNTLYGVGFHVGYLAGVVLALGAISAEPPKALPQLGVALLSFATSFYAFANYALADAREEGEEEDDEEGWR